LISDPTAEISDGFVNTNNNNSNVAPTFRKGVGIDSETSRRRRNKIFLKQVDRSKDGSESPKMSPFGFYLLPSPKKLADSQLTHVLFGLTNRQKSTCWLDAILMLGLSLDTLRNWMINLELKAMPRKFHSSFAGLLRNLYLCWLDQTSIFFRKEMNDSQKSLWNQFNALGFERKDSHCVIETFLVLLQQVAVYFQDNHWIILDIEKVKEMSDDELDTLKKDGMQFIIALNHDYTSLDPEMKITNFRLHSIITFEEILPANEDGDEPINHFMCIGLEEDGYSIYDDLLFLSPGGYQGGFVPKQSESYPKNMKSFFNNVPLAVFRLDTK